MAALSHSSSSFSSFLLTIILISYFFQLLSLTLSTSIPLSSSSVASRQYEIWSSNVVNDMPNVILSKLSPLSIRDSDHFFSLVSNPSFVSNSNFCSLANLACASNLNTIRPLSNSYSKTYSDLKNNKQNPDAIKPLSNAYSGPNVIKPLSNVYVYHNNKQNPNAIKPLSNANFGPNAIKPLSNAYAYQNNKQNPDAIKPLSNSDPNVIKPLSNFYVYHNNKQNPNTIKPLSNANSGLNVIKPLSNSYGYQNNKKKPYTIKPLSNANSGPNVIKPLSNSYGYHNKQNTNAIEPLSKVTTPTSKTYIPNSITPLSKKNKHTTDSDDPFSFFRLSILKQGKTVHLPDLKDTSPFRAFLPSLIASKFPLTSNEVLKRVFPESFVSPITMDAMERTFGYCNAPTMKGEIKSCVRSLEEMIQFAKKGLGVKQLVSLTSKSTEGSGKVLLIGNIKVFHDTKNIVSCHEIYLPFSTYFCHLISSSRLFSVELLEPETRIAVNTVVAVCHMDTSEWPADHVAFRLLKFTPGKGEACHWFSQVDLAWIGA